jgi:putative ABC transport system substrate-binding protein
MSYGPATNESTQRAASFVDKILRGQNAGEIPVEQPTRLELVINRRTAEALGLKIPQVLLL